MNPATGPHGTPRKQPVVTAETTTEKTTEDKLREECARLRADNRALKRAEARRLAPQSAALYGPATRKALEGPLLTGRELVVASKERPYIVMEEARIALAAGRVPHGAVAYVKWWYGETQYVEGRAPMAGTSATSRRTMTADETRAPTTSRRVRSTPDPRAAP